MAFVQFRDAFPDADLATFEAQTLALAYDMNSLGRLTWHAATDYIEPHFRKNTPVYKAMMRLTGTSLRNLCDNVVCTVLPRSQEMINVESVLGAEFTSFVRGHTSNLPITGVFYGRFMLRHSARRARRTYVRPYPNTLPDRAAADAILDVLALYETVMNHAAVYIDTHGSTQVRRQAMKDVARRQKALVVLKSIV